MKLQVLSDIHLEFEGFVLPDAGADVLVLAGDTAPGSRGVEWALDLPASVPVLYLLGNHEFYHHQIPGLIDKLRNITRGMHVHILENDSLVIGGVRFLGCSLWTDFLLNGNAPLSELDAAQSMNDFRLISKADGLPFQPVDAKEIHRVSRAWLEGQLGIPHRPTVVLTHHAPSSKSVPNDLAGSPLNPVYASNLEDLILSRQPALWVHGHMHQPVDYHIGKTRIVSNPRGYPNQRDNGFDPRRIIEV